MVPALLPIDRSDSLVEGGGRGRVRAVRGGERVRVPMRDRRGVVVLILLLVALVFQPAVRAAEVGVPHRMGTVQGGGASESSSTHECIDGEAFPEELSESLS